MPLDKNISVGNLVSWGLVILAFATGYAKLGSAAEQNVKDIAVAKEVADRAEDRATRVIVAQNMEMQKMAIDIAVIKTTISSMDSKLNELKAGQQPK